jgi:hypothetical protein
MLNKFKPPYTFSTHIGEACAKHFRTFPDLAEKLKMELSGKSIYTSSIEIKFK